MHLLLLPTALATPHCKDRPAQRKALLPLLSCGPLLPFLLSQQRSAATESAIGRLTIALPVLLCRLDEPDATGSGELLLLRFALLRARLRLLQMRFQFQLLKLFFCP